MLLNGVSVICIMQQKLLIWISMPFDTPADPPILFHTLDVTITMATKSPGGTIELLIRRADNLYDVGSFGDRKIDPFVKCIPMWNDKCSKEKKDQWKATNYVDDAGVNPVVRCDTDTCQLNFFSRTTSQQ